MDKRFLGILAVIVLVFAGFFMFGKNNGGGSSTAAAPSNHIEGKGQSGVTFTEYGDYQCSACSQYYGLVKQAVAKLSDQIYFQFRNLPLTSIHGNALAGARAAEAASLQGKFWQMHDLLYTNQDPSGKTGWVASQNPLNDYFVKYAQQIGLDIERFKSDYASSKVNDTINADIAAFNKTGKPLATPSFFIDGKYIDNSRLSSVDNIVSELNAAIAAKKNQ